MSVLRCAPLVLFLLDVFTGSCRLGAQQSPPVPAPASADRPAPVAFPSGEDTELGSQITTLLSDPPVARAHWGVAVTTMEGTPLYGLNEGKLFPPASTAKLFTTAAAMALLGPGFTVTTSVYFPPAAPDGTVNGDITLVGRGDANLSGRTLPWTSTGSHVSGDPAPNPLHDFDDLAAAVAARGVRHITGNVVASSYPWDPYPQGWAAEDLPWGYGAPVAALSANDNQLLLTVNAGRTPASPVSITLSPDLETYRVISTLSVAAPGAAAKGVTVHHTPGDGVLRLQGSLAPGASFTAEIAVDDPPRFAAEALRHALIAHGITVDRAVTTTRQEPDDVNFLREMRSPIPPSASGHGVAMGSFLHQRPVLIDHTSAPLVEDITPTLKDSLNLHAELILRDLALPASLSTGYSPAVEGGRRVHQWLLDAGIDDNDFTFYDGSGLSTKDLVTPRAEVQLLAYAAKQPWFAQWKAALPIGGVDGTLALRFTGPPLQGHVFAKTGTLGESRALAGYVLCASGREVIFSILDADHEPGSSADRAAMDRIVAAIAAFD